MDNVQFFGMHQKIERCYLYVLLLIIMAQQPIKRETYEEINKLITQLWTTMKELATLPDRDPDASRNPTFLLCVNEHFVKTLGTVKLACALSEAELANYEATKNMTDEEKTQYYFVRALKSSFPPK